MLIVSKAPAGFANGWLTINVCLSQWQSNEWIWCNRNSTFFLVEVKSGNWSNYVLQIMQILKKKAEYFLSVSQQSNIENLYHNQWKICQLEFQKLVLNKHLPFWMKRKHRFLNTCVHGPISASWLHHSNFFLLTLRLKTSFCDEKSHAESHSRWIYLLSVSLEKAWDINLARLKLAFVSPIYKCFCAVI